MHVGRHDPGECPVCGAAHSACGGGTPTVIVQLPARDAADVGVGVDLATGPDRSVTLGDGTDGRPFSTSTYRGTPRPR